MGSNHFSLDRNLAQFFRENLNIDVFIETGTYQGKTTALAAELFPIVYTIEGSPDLFTKTSQELNRFPNVRRFLGDSPLVMREINKNYADKNCLFWLDAHWCNAPMTAKIRSECPVLEELEAIENLGQHSVILIDDARLFLDGPPSPHNPDDWPDLSKISVGLQRLSNVHRLSIFKDIVVFAPTYLSEKLIEFRERLASEATSGYLTFNAHGQIGYPSLSRPSNRLTGFLNQNIEESSQASFIFGKLLIKENIRAFLDIGAHKGEFAMRTRRNGFQGTIYSAEPVSDSHNILQMNASTDPRWIVLPKQAAGSSHDIATINISQNSYSSSLLRVRQEHLEAAPQTQVARSEECVVTKTKDLLHSFQAHGIEAIKIDTQGYEKEVLKGLEELIADIRLVLVEMNSVNCYENCPDMIGLDQWLIKDCGFKRIVLQPAFFNEADLTCQQYDGIYLREFGTSESRRNTPYISCDVVEQLVTSVPIRGNCDRGETYHHNNMDWQSICIDSWTLISNNACSISENDPECNHLEFLQVNERPSIFELLQKTRLTYNKGRGRCVLSNADIAYTESFLGLLPKLDTSIVYFGNRTEISLDPRDGSAINRGCYSLGYDYFILPLEFVEILAERWSSFQYFKIGQPWWDYLLPITTISLGIPTKKISTPDPLALHLQHETRYSDDQWYDHGIQFIEAISSINNSGHNYAKSLTSEIITNFDQNKSDDIKIRLLNISQLVLKYFSS